MEIVRTASFEKAAKKLGATEAELAAVEAAIAADPEAGELIPGLKGLRKIRFAMKGRGKSGGGRAIYYVLRSRDAALMIFAYSKTEQADLSPRQRRAVLAMLEELDDG